MRFRHTWPLRKYCWIVEGLHPQQASIRGGELDICRKPAAVLGSNHHPRKSSTAKSSRKPRLRAGGAGWLKGALESRASGSDVIELSIGHDPQRAHRSRTLAGRMSLTVGRYGGAESIPWLSERAEALRIELSHSEVAVEKFQRTQPAPEQNRKPDRATDVGVEHRAHQCTHNTKEAKSQQVDRLLSGQRSSQFPTCWVRCGQRAESSARCGYASKPTCACGMASDIRKVLAPRPSVVTSRNRLPLKSAPCRQSQEK